MPPKSLVKAGIATVGMVTILFWAITVQLKTTDSFDSREISGLIQYACLFLGAAGVMLVLRGICSLLLEFFGIAKSLRIFPALVLRNVLPLRQHCRMPMIADLPHFPLLLSSFLLILMFVFIILGTPLTSRGLLVKVRNHTFAAWQRSPATETLGVYLDEEGQFWMSGQPVARDRLRANLKEELGRRIVWTVYFEAQDGARFSHAAEAMDTIQSLGAKLVWVTPQTRKEFNREQVQGTFETQSAN
jgi:biopolymer transport protein ExbD